MSSSESITYTKFEILPGLYLSRFPKEIPLGITHVLNMCTTPHPFDDTRKYLHIAIDDIDNIKPHIRNIIDFIERGLESKGKVLVHCALGLNRSVSAIVAYLCHLRALHSFEAVSFIKERKSDVKPSALFLKQIDQYFGREQQKEDPLVGFHRRLQQRKLAAAKEAQDQEPENQEE